MPYQGGGFERQFCRLMMIARLGSWGATKRSLSQIVQDLCGEFQRMCQMRDSNGVDGVDVIAKVGVRNRE
jgi:hypothetical protein